MDTLCEFGKQQVNWPNQDQMRIRRHNSNALLSLQRQNKGQILNFNLTSSAAVSGRSSALRIVPTLQVSSHAPSHGRRGWRPLLTRCTSWAVGPSQANTTKWPRRLVTTLAKPHPQLQRGEIPHISGVWVCAKGLSLRQKQGKEGCCLVWKERRC